MIRFFSFVFLLLIAACAGTAPVTDDNTPLELKPVSYNALPGWGNDNLTETLPALDRSCARIIKSSAERAFGSKPEMKNYSDWRRICMNFAALDKSDNAAAKSFFEQYFEPYEASAAGNTKGLFTGYYEASLRGSKTRQGPYQTPLYTRPDDLVMVNLGDFREELKGQRIAGRVQGGNLKPYEDRAAIVAGSWPHNDKVLVWADSPVDAFYVQIQGSGVVQMDDGSVMRIGYAGQNGHVYYAIGKELVTRGYLTKEDVSMQAIRSWLESNPDEAVDVMNTNRSYVFFKEMEEGGPVGGEGVVLTPERSLAIDHSKIPYGVPVWLEAENPKLNRLMMAQDTGGAIRGAVRGDVFWGYGERAETFAGPMKSPGRYWLLLPKV